MFQVLPSAIQAPLQTTSVNVNVSLMKFNFLNAEYLQISGSTKRKQQIQASVFIIKRESITVFNDFTRFLVGTAKGEMREKKECMPLHVSLFLNQKTYSFSQPPVTDYIYDICIYATSILSLMGYKVAAGLHGIWQQERSAALECLDRFHLCLLPRPNVSQTRHFQ